MIRVATPGTHPAFVAAIADLVRERALAEPPLALSELGPWASVCAVGCCANQGGVVPTVAGEDSTVGVMAAAT
jgi:ferrochelatase